MNRTNLVLALGTSALVSSVALAHTGKKEPNCDINGKKEHVKSETICSSKKGTWLTQPVTASTQPTSPTVGATTTPASAVSAPGSTSTSTAPATQATTPAK